LARISTQFARTQAEAIQEVSGRKNIENSLIIKAAIISL
jgi:hypothetical protein